jgi:hypothetical protein
MRVQAARFRTAGLAAAAVTLLAVGVSGCSGGSSPGAVITPNIPTSPAGSSSPSPSATDSTTADPGSTQPSYDAGAALALKQQQIGCKTALGPLFSAVTNGTADQAKVLSVTPPAAKQAIQDSFTQLDLLMQQDPNALTDGNASKAIKALDAFCATPAGAQFVGTTPAVALKPPKPAKPSTHHP